MSRTNHYAVQQISDSSHYRHELNGDGFEPFSSSEQVFREYKAPIADANPWGNYSMDRSDAHEEFHSGKDDRIHRPVPHHARSDVQQRYVPYYGPPRHHHHHYSYQPPQYYRPRRKSTYHLQTALTLFRNFTRLPRAAGSCVYDTRLTRLYGIS